MVLHPGGLAQATSGTEAPGVPAKINYTYPVTCLSDSIPVIGSLLPMFIKIPESAATNGAVLTALWSYIVG